MGNNELTIFTAGEEERQKAITNLLEGKTPIAEVKTRPMRGGGDANYVNTYYMTRQISLVTGFRWESEPLEEKFWPNEENPTQIGVKMKVTIYDAQGHAYSHTSWGGKEVAKWTNPQFDKAGKETHAAGTPISIFDDMKAAYSDGIKKCLSYFGIANDIYGGKELEYFQTDEDESDQKKNSQLFGRWLTEQRILVSDVCKILKISNLAEITDHKSAKEQLEAWKKGGRKPIEESSSQPETETKSTNEKE